MRPSQQTLRARRTDAKPSIYSHLLEGYRFRVCEDPASFAAALDVRREVYNANCGYDVPVPDAYDDRSWLLIAEHVESGQAVGTRACSTARARRTARPTGPSRRETDCAHREIAH